MNVNKWEIVGQEYDQVDDYIVEYMTLKNKDGVKLEISKTPDHVDDDPSVIMLEPVWEDNVIEVEDCWEMSMEEIVKEIQSGKYDVEISDFLKKRNV